MPEDKFVHLNGLRMHFRDFGGEGKPIALFLHGLTGNRYSFDHIAPLIADMHRVMALDFRGHGDRDWHPAADYAFSRHVSDRISLLATLALKKVLGGSKNLFNLVPYLQMWASWRDRSSPARRPWTP